MNHRTRCLALGLALAAGTLPAVAQTAVAPSATTAPATVGVSERTATEAARKAVPRSDTGTLVRTAPTAPDQARAAAASTGAAATRATTNDTAATMPAAAGPAPAAPMRRAPRADRN